MQYCNIPRLGRNASIIGFGGEHMLGRTEQEVDRTIKYAIGKEINIYDLFGRSQNSGALSPRPFPVIETS